MQLPFHLLHALRLCSPSCRSLSPCSPTPHMSHIRLLFSASHRLSSGFLLHTLQSEVSTQTFSPPVQPRCRHHDCAEPVRPNCPMKFRNLHCTKPRCVLHDPLRPLLLSFIHLALSAQLPLLVGLLVVLFTMASWVCAAHCWRAKNSVPLMCSLPVDHFRYCGPCSGFLFLPLWRPLSQGPPTRLSLASHLGLCVCSFHVPHAGIAFDTRIQFLRTLAVSIHRLATPHKHPASSRGGFIHLLLERHS